MNLLIRALFYSIFLFLAHAQTLWACAVCFGDPNSRFSKGVAAGVLVLLGVVATVLGWAGALIWSWVRRAKKLGPLD